MTKGKSGKKDRTKIVTALKFSHSDKLKTCIKCEGSNTPTPNPAAAYHWF